MKALGSMVKDFVRRADMLLLGLCCACTIFGIVLISSATATYPSRSFVPVQTFAFILGIAFFVLFTILDLDIIADKWPLLIAFEVVFLLLLLPFGESGDTGNTGWIRFLGIGVQPSEVVKVVFIIMMAKHMTYLKEYRKLNSLLSVGQLLIHFVLTFGLLMFTSDDLGSALVYFIIFVVMLFVAGVRIFWFLAGAAAVALATPFVWKNFLDKYQRDRILAPYNPAIDPDGWGVRWQPMQSKIALASGRLTGTGLFQGTQTQSDSLSGKHTDFIFSVAGEELGMIACIVILVLLMLIAVRCVVIGLRSRNTMSMLVCFGVAATIFFQTAENTGMCMGLTPVVGITLPFFSYGGSSVMSLFAAMGLVSGVRYRPKPERFQRYIL